VAQSPLPLTDVLTVFSYPVKTPLVLDDGPNSSFSEKTTIWLSLVAIVYVLVLPHPTLVAQSRIMELEDESVGFPIDPHRQMIRDLQIFIQSYQQQFFLIFRPMDGNQDYLHFFQQQDIPNKACTQLDFNHDKNIDGSISTLVESCNLVNIHKLKHGDVPVTHNTGSLQIDLGFLSYAATEFIYRCGVLDFNTLFSSDHRVLFLDIDILWLLGYSVQGT
jgi:hypothetical protein